MKPHVLALALAIFSSFAPISSVWAARSKPADVQAHPSGEGKSDRRQGVAELAAKGDADAQFQMGEQMAPVQRIASVKDKKAIRQALVWFMLSGKNGNLQGAIAAAKIHESLGSEKDAARWWFRAGQLGDVGARKRYIDLFLKGMSYGLEGKDGVNWLSEWALTTHNPAVKLSLGSAFETGVGGVPNYGEARRWFLDAALDWSSDAMVRLADLELHQPASWRIPDKEKDADDHWTGPVYRTVRLYARDESGALDLGRSAIARQESVAPDHLIFVRPAMADGEQWLITAANLGLPKAKTLLGLAKLDGITLPLDRTEGVWLLSSAACANDPDALSALVSFWQDRNPFFALTFADVAARKGRPVAPDVWDRLSKSAQPRQAARAKQIAQDWCAQN